MNIRSKVGKGRKGIDWEYKVGFFQVIVLNQRIRPHPSLLNFIAIPPVQTPPCYESSTVIFLENFCCRRPFRTYLNTMVYEFLCGFCSVLQAVSGKLDLSHSIFLTFFLLDHGIREASLVKNPHNLTSIIIAANLIASQRCNELSFHSCMIIILSFI